MSDPNSLLVPMSVEALVVNHSVRTGGNAFLRNEMQFDNLARYRDADPGFSMNDIAFTGTAPVHGVPADEYYNGIYLKWRMPTYFTHGEQDSVTGSTDYPEVPNRWLIVRFSGPITARVATAWIIESDYRLPTPPPTPANYAQQGSHYVAPGNGNTPIGALIGRNVALGTWTEPGTTLHLRAIGPGDPAFSAYQTHCNNVFSFVDTIADYSAQELSYMVLGWYSDATEDPLKGVDAQTFLARMTELGWSLPANTPSDAWANRSLLYGLTSGVSWQTTTAPPGGAPKGTTALAFGNTSVEALTALIQAQSEQQGVDVDPILLQALQLGLIDELDEPNGLAVIEEGIKSSYFNTYTGGYHWDIVDAPHATDQPTQGELDKERIWLAELNQNQALLDAAERQLGFLQQQVYVIWLKYLLWPSAHKGTSYIPQLNDRANLSALLNPTVAGTPAYLAAQAKAVVDGLLGKVPHGDTPQQLQDSIDQYELDHQLPSYRLLKRSAASTFREVNNPVALIAGAGASGIVTAPEETLCRLDSQLVNGFKFTWNGTDYTVTAATSGLTIPQPDLSGVSGAPWTAELAELLVDEMFFLDPDDATMVGAALAGVPVATIQAAMGDPASAIGTYPAGALDRWTQNPWHPFRLLYQVRYYPISYGTPENPNWIFADGEYYWNGLPASVQPDTSFQGNIQLSTAAAFNLRSRIVKFLADNPYLPAEERKEFEDLLKFVDGEDQWDLLSQALNGFNDQAQLQLPGVFMSPGAFPLPGSAPLLPLVGDERGWTPAVGNIPISAPKTDPFQPWRAGQFVLTSLVLVDEWGQALWLVTNGTTSSVEIYLPPTLTPVATSNAVAFTVSTLPVLSGANPPLVNAGTTELMLKLTGTGFQQGDCAMWNETILPAVILYPTEMTVMPPSDLLASPVAIELFVVRGGVNSNRVPFAVVAGPAISSVAPNLILAGMAEASLFPLTVNGLNFASDAVVQWNGAALDTAVMSATQLVAQVPSGNVATRGTAAITVVSATVTSPAATVTIVPAATIGSIVPGSAVVGQSGMTVDVYGVGFEEPGRIQWNGADLAGTFIDHTHVTAVIPAGFLAAPAVAQVTQVIGHSVLPESSDTVIQLTPALLQPARLEFDLTSATSSTPISLSGADDSVCGWVVPNHLDHSLAAYGPTGVSFGELAVGASVDGTAHVCWTRAPGSPYATLAQLAAAVPHFGPFLLELSTLTPAIFTDFLNAVDETMWSAQPADAAMDENLMALIGRPLAMVRASLQLQTEGQPTPDPSWQYTFSAAPPLFTAYKFAVELGDIANVEDGLIGYFLEDDYTVFNIVQEADFQPDGYLKPIGVEGNYIHLPPDNTTRVSVSMLVDPRAPVHARTGILPDVSVAVPPAQVSTALANLEVTFRVDAILTDQQTTAATVDTLPKTTVFMPLPKVSAGTWDWVEYEGTDPVTYTVAVNDTVAKLSTSQPVLRQGVLQLTGAAGAPPKAITTRQRLAAPGVLPRKR